MSERKSQHDGFDEDFYLSQYPYVRDVGIDPKRHYQRYGARLGYIPCKGYLPAVDQSRPPDQAPLHRDRDTNHVQPWAAPPSIGEPLERLNSNGLVSWKVSPADFDAVVQEMDLTWYKSLFPGDEVPDDLVVHYLTEGWQQGYEPTPWFSSRHYLAANEDVRRAGINPFLHYVTVGKQQNNMLPLLHNRSKAAPINAFFAHSYAAAPGPLFEEFDPTIGAGKKPLVKALAYYLPQYHAFPENDRFWGKGFTEWRNVMRGMPRFAGHLQPRIPRDLGCYNLDEGNTLRRQFEMARAAGLHGFCFYHYWFDGKRVMEKPMEMLLADKTLDLPFAIMWANENWSRTWDGADTQILLKQSYLEKDDINFVDDLARHFKDERYIRLDGRPIFYIYRPGHIPDTKGTIARWRNLFDSRHQLKPLFFMAQSFDDRDPRVHGFDGAIEFPPHKVLNVVPNIIADVSLIDPGFTGMVAEYNDVVAVSMQEKPADFPLIRTILPSWDNDARRPGRSTIIARSSPEAFGRWARWAIKQAQLSPIMGESFICVNAWNEWAEGTYLEPDTHYGAAYLNALARALFEG